MVKLIKRLKLLDEILIGKLIKVSFYYVFDNYGEMR